MKGVNTMEVVEEARQVNESVESCMDRIDTLQSMLHAIVLSLDMALSKTSDATLNMDVDTIAVIRDNTEKLDESLRDLVVKADDLLYPIIKAIKDDDKEVDVEHRRSVLLKHFVESAFT